MTNAITLSLENEMTSKSAESFHETLENIFSNSGIALVIDLSEVEYVSSMWLAVILVAQSMAQETGNEINIINPLPLVLQTLNMIGADNMLLAA